MSHELRTALNAIIGFATCSAWSRSSCHRNLQLETLAFAGDLHEALRMLRPRTETSEVALNFDVYDAPQTNDQADRRAFKQIVCSILPAIPASSPRPAVP